MDEAVAWAKRSPNHMPGRSEIEIRPFYEAADLAEFMTPEELSALVKGNAGSSASPDTVVWRIAIANFKSEVEEILREQKKD